jgi:hypothetical protein
MYVAYDERIFNHGFSTFLYLSSSKNHFDNDNGYRLAISSIIKIMLF